MSTPKPHSRDRAIKSSPLVEELAKVLPKDCRFSAYHLSTPPIITDALCYPPAYKPSSSTSKSSAGTEIASKDRRPSKPLKTYCEKHFLAVSVDAARNDGSELNKQVLVLGLEVYIYTTAFSTIIFVAKADSTGYLNILDLPKGTPSPIREVTAAFVSFLVSSRRRQSKQLVVNLFARSQSQYLFPGSIKNAGKHVLDDRGLIKWWCRVLNPLLGNGHGPYDVGEGWDRIHGYLVIPGLDNYETRAFLPRTSDATTNWTLDHPLEHISPYPKDLSTFGPDIPLRCLIPTFPDDPKARFVQELEESTSEKIKRTSGWKSPRTLEQFWEMMAFRQECSSGRMVGFVWIVLDPQPSTKSAKGPKAAVIPTPNASFSASMEEAARPSTPDASQQDIASLVTPAATPSKSKSDARNTRRKRSGKKVLKGIIIPRKPQLKTHQRARFPARIDTPHYYWPETGRGQVILNDSGYKRAVELLLHLEFATVEQAIASTMRWVKEVNVGEDWGLAIVGQRVTSLQPVSTNTGTVNNLSGMIKRKRPADDQATNGASPSSAPVNTLGGGLIRKKVKSDAAQ